MSLELLAIDLGKRSFHIHGIDSDGVIISRKTSRSKLIETIEELAPETIAMEACASAHYWGRRFLADGPSGSADQSALREAIRQGIQERRGGCRRNLRSRYAPDDALRAGQID